MIKCGKGGSTMKVLVVGGTGMIGLQAARELQRRGAEVTVGARKDPVAGAPTDAFPLLVGDYTNGGFSHGELARFDTVVFAAGNDIRHIPAGADVADALGRDCAREHGSVVDGRLLRTGDALYRHHPNPRRSAGFALGAPFVMDQGLAVVMLTAAATLVYLGLAVANHRRGRVGVVNLRLVGLAQLSAGDAAALAAALRAEAPRLRLLSLRGCRLGDAAACALLQGLRERADAVAIFARVGDEHVGHAAPSAASGPLPAAPS
jgi:hypothetical protein